MRITKISIDGLFGIFNHEIRLNVEERITIIHGANGVGKTIILTMLNDFFHSRYSIFRKTPFEKFVIYFDNAHNIEIVKKNHINDKKTTSHRYDIKFLLKENDLVIKDFIPRIEDNEEKIEDYDSQISWYSQIIRRKISMDINEIEEDSNKNDDDICEWLEQITNNINIHLINSQRLINIEKINKKKKSYSTVSNYSEKLANLMDRKFTEYGSISQSLERTFPSRVLQLVQVGNTDLQRENLSEQLNHLQKQRNRLINVGLLNKEEDSDFNIQSNTIDNTDESTKMFLSVYVEDVEKKLNVFKDIADKIELLKKIIDKKFAYSSKQINFDKERGFIFTTNKDLSSPSENENKKISPTDLSSGEQHELIMLYDLLFNVKPNSLVLIDEPELSLHVSWLVDFLTDLESIIKIADLDILMATHSPDLINDRWDLTVELKK